MLAAADRHSIAKYQPEPERRRKIAEYTGGRNTKIMLINSNKYRLKNNKMYARRTLIFFRNKNAI